MTVMTNPRLALAAQFACAFVEGALATRTSPTLQERHALCQEAWSFSLTMLETMPDTLLSALGNDVAAHQVLQHEMMAVPEAATGRRG